MVTFLLQVTHSVVDVKNVLTGGRGSCGFIIYCVFAARFLLSYLTTMFLISTLIVGDVVYSTVQDAGYSVIQY